MRTSSCGVTASRLSLGQKQRGLGVGKVITNAAMVFTLLCVSHSIEVKEAIHIGGNANHRCDQLSRIAESGMAVAEVLASIGLGGIQNLILERDSTAMKVVECCRPDRYFNAEEDFIAFWKEIKQTVGSSAVTNPPSRPLLN